MAVYTIIDMGDYEYTCTPTKEKFGKSEGVCQDSENIEGGKTPALTQAFH